MREEKSALGEINIHEAVIGEIAAEAAKEVEGVVGLASDFKNDILKLFGKKDTSGVRVIINEGSEVKLNLSVVVKYGVNIPDIAHKIQENVKTAVEKMTNLSLLDVNVNVHGIKGGKS